MERVLGLKVSTNTIERICLDVGNDLEKASADDWKGVLTGESIVPQVAIVSYDGGRIRTRMPDCGPGVHLSGKGWNETKNAIFVSATSETSLTDPEPNPPKCFFDPVHVGKLTETAKAKEKQRKDADVKEVKPTPKAKKRKRQHPKHKPKRIHRTLISSMKNSKEFGKEMEKEAKRRRFGEATRKAFIGDGLSCNWSIHQAHFKDYTAILDFIHAVSYVYQAAIVCFGKNEQAWNAYSQWMTRTWQGNVSEVISVLKTHQERIGLPPKGCGEDDPREQLRLIVGYLQNNSNRMRYDEYRRQGLPVTSAWMESAVKEINYRVKGTDMFWNNPVGAEAILQIRAASLSDDDRLVRLLSRRAGSGKVRRSASNTALAA